MFEEFVGMNVEVLVSFSSYTTNTSYPVSYYGTLLESNDNRVVLNVTDRQTRNLFGNNSTINSKMIINNNYVIYMRLIG